jgi:hypothetical protein
MMKKLKAISMLLALCVLSIWGLSIVAKAASLADVIDSAKKKLTIAQTRLNKLKDNRNEEFKRQVELASKTTSQALDKLVEARTLYDNPENTEAAVKAKIGEAQNLIVQSLDIVKSASGMVSKPATQDDLTAATASLNEAKGILQSVVQGQIPTTTTSPAASPSASPGAGEIERGDGWLAALGNYAGTAFWTLLISIALGLLVYAVLLLTNIRGVTDTHLNEGMPKVLSAIKGKQDELAKQVAAYAGVNKEINQRLTDLHTELRQVSRSLQISQQSTRQASAQPVSAQSLADTPRDGEMMPSFPISADDFLRRMQRKATVVKRDFQNDILISDPDGKGEFVLIRDARIADERQELIVVPRVTQFQMQQDYYNFYQKYYECSNPESGTVWIIDPAVVGKVSGGWELRGKGRLEVR